MGLQGLKGGHVGGVGQILPSYQACITQQISTDSTVATGDDEKREDEGQNDLHPHQGQIPSMIGIENNTGLHIQARDVVCIPQSKGGGRASTSQNPHEDAREPGALGVPRALGAERMHDGQVAVHAHGRDEEDGRVEVEVVHRPTDLAGQSAKGPAVALGVVDGPQRQRQQEQQVGHTQVQHESVCYGSPRGASVGQHGHRQGVGHSPQHADDAVDGRDDRGHWDGRPVGAGVSGGGSRGVQIGICG